MTRQRPASPPEARPPERYLLRTVLEDGGPGFRRIAVTDAGNRRGFAGGRGRRTPGPGRRAPGLPA